MWLGIIFKSFNAALIVIGSLSLLLCKKDGGWFSSRPSSVHSIFDLKIKDIFTPSNSTSPYLKSIGVTSLTSSPSVSMFSSLSDSRSLVVDSNFLLFLSTDIPFNCLNASIIYSIYRIRFFHSFFSYSLIISAFCVLLFFHELKFEKFKCLLKKNQPISVQMTHLSSSEIFYRPSETFSSSKMKSNFELNSVFV